MNATKLVLLISLVAIAAGGYWSKKEFESRKIALVAQSAARTVHASAVAQHTKMLQTLTSSEESPRIPAATLFARVVTWLYAQSQARTIELRSVSSLAAGGMPGVNTKLAEIYRTSPYSSKLVEAPMAITVTVPDFRSLVEFIEIIKSAPIVVDGFITSPTGTEVAISLTLIGVPD